MSAIRNIPVGRKFALAFGMVCALCIGLGTFTFFTFHGIAANTTDISQNSLPSIIWLSDMRGTLNTLRRQDLDLLLCQAPACIAQHSGLRQKALQEFEENDKAYQPMVDTGTERDLYQAMKASFTRYQDISDRGALFITKGNSSEALDLLGSEQTNEAFDKSMTALQQLLDFNVKEGQTAASDAEHASKRATWINVAATFLIVALCALIGTVLTRVIAPRMLVAKGALERLAAKDLTTHVTVTGTDEIGQMGVALNDCAVAIRSIVHSVAKGAETLSAATTEISARSVQSAGNANTQSSKTNQIAAAAQEMTATIGEISHNAESAASASRVSAETADQGGAVMQAAAVTMEKIAAATNSVSEKMTSLAAPLRRDRQGRQRDSGDQRANQPAGPECSH